MKLSDMALVLSTVLAPLIAVQVSQWLDRRRQWRSDRYQIFRTLMVTRAFNLEPRHVEALNMIEVVYTQRRDAAVREAWARYLAHLNNRGLPEQVWLGRRIELMNDLLYVLAKNLRYKIERSRIESGWYAPNSFSTLEQEQQQIRQGLVRVLSGQDSIPIRAVQSQLAPAAAQSGVAQPMPGANGQAGAPVTPGM